MRRTFAGYLLGCLWLWGQPLVAQDLEQVILRLSSEAEIAAYWEQIKQADQTHRGLESDQEIDNGNFKKTLLMIRHHGFPRESLAPYLVFVHQTSGYVVQHYLSVLVTAFERSEADTFWTMHCIRAAHRSIYATDLIQPDPSNYHTVLERLPRYRRGDPDLDLAPFDSLYAAYQNDVHRVIDTKPIRSWIDDEGDHVNWYSLGDSLYTHTMWSDSSYSMPQRVDFNAATGKYTFAHGISDTYMEIAPSGALLCYKRGLLDLELRPSQVAIER